MPPGNDGATHDGRENHKKHVHMQVHVHAWHRGHVSTSVVAVAPMPASTQLLRACRCGAATSGTVAGAAPLRERVTPAVNSRCCLQVRMTDAAAEHVCNAEGA